MPDPNSETLIEKFRHTFLTSPDAQIFRFLADGEGEGDAITNADLDVRARALAVTLRENVQVGERALIICPPGLDYVVSFLACLYSGVIAVPVYPPNPALLKRTLPRLVAVVADARPAVVLAPSFIASMAPQLAELAPAMSALPWQSVDDIDPDAAERWQRPDLHGSDTAFLQYTSGSTGRPKGVVVSHANLLHNLGATQRLFIGDDTDAHSIIWLPPYHDMGLIGGLLQPAYGGFPVTFMSPLAFLKRPVRWLQAISDHRGTHGGGPNFAYDLCVAKVSPEQRANLDLSSWKVAFTGAEPIRADTLDRFSAAFGACGFNRRAFYPCYGLAEATLIASGGQRDGEPVIRKRPEDSRAGVGCGTSIPGQQLLIVDPVTRTRLAEGQVGEIWVSGPSVAKGYWQSPVETAEVFAARLADTDQGPFLRTGDLGLLDGPELFVTGRVKDVIIIAGKNHYPQDIEESLERADPALRPGSGIACSVEVDGDEQLVIIYELASNPAKLDLERVISSIRATASQEHGLQVHDVVLVRRGNVPKTSSGKLQRSAGKAAFVDGNLESVASWRLSSSPTPSVPAIPSVPTTPAIPGRTDLERRLTRAVAEKLNVAAETLDPTQPIATYGLPSLEMVALVGELEQWVGRTLPATLVWEYPTIEALAELLSADPAATRSEPDVAPPVATAEPVAIVGIGCRFPGGVDDPAALWQLLCDGRDAVTEVPADRWAVADFQDDDPLAPGKTNTRWGGFLDGVDRFDPQFFGISAHEAARMDPQQRLLAEVSWEALDDAGVVAGELAGSATGVFVGISTNDYGNLQFQDLDRIDAYTGTGNASSIAANRLSYLFDLRGPSMSIDTACSSSLVAVHQACLSLARGDCTAAIAGGVNVILSPALAINFSKAGAMASDGRCKPFDASADGYVRSEGAAMVVLKPLARALADRDTIYAVIRGGAVNQDGRTNGLMAPNPQAQEAVLRSAYADAGVTPHEVDYIEAHGTGTLLGDPIEAKALAAVVGSGRARDLPCLIGSVKSNLGHLEAAAGIAGLVKAALMVRNRVIPPSLHFAKANPYIPFGDLSLRVAATGQPWPAGDRPALVGVSAFGFGGTNAHLVVEQAPPARPDDDESDPRHQEQAQLLTISANGEQALKDLAGRYEAQLTQPDAAVSAASLCRAAAVRRTHHEQRLAIVGTTIDDLRQGLVDFRREQDRAGTSSGGRRVARRPAPVFVFSGQGPRWWPLSRDLLEGEPVFRQSIEESDELLRRDVDWSLLEQLTTEASSSRLGDTAVAQPALCALQIALASLWRSWGIEPAAVVGHSIGEVAAAQVAGVLSRPDALRIAVHRGRVIRAAIGQGRMAAAGVSFEEGQRILADLALPSLSIAASNGPRSIVFAGETTALRALAGSLEADGVFCRVLESVDYASHSPQMDPLLGELRALLGDIKPGTAAVAMISTVTGRSVDGTELDGSYWATNLRQPVLFDQVITGLIGSGHDTFIELSPHPMLGDPIAQRMDVEAADGVVVASLHRDEPGRAAILGEVGRLYTAGFPVDWRKVYSRPNSADGATRAGAMVALPSYPWQRQRCWFDDDAAVARSRRRRVNNPGHPVLETSMRSAVEPRAQHWSAQIDLEGFPYLKDHRIEGTAVLPASLLLDAALAGARKLLADDSASLEDVRFTRMTVLGEVSADTTFQLVLFPETAATGEFRIFTRDAGEPAGDWTPAADGRFRSARSAGGDEGPADSLAQARGRCPKPIDPAEYYSALSRAGLEYGPSFQGLEGVWSGDREAVGQLRPLADLAADLAADLTADREPYLIHPALLDSCLQVLAAAIGPDLTQPAPTYLPVSIGGFTVDAGAVAVPRWAHVTIGKGDPGDDEVTGGAVTLFDEAGARVATLDGITLRRLAPNAAADPVADALLELRWQLVAGDAPKPPVPVDSWLLLADRDGVSQALGATIRAAGGQVVTVTAGERYRRNSETDYEVNPARPDDFVALLAQLRDGGGAGLTGVLHAWSLDPAAVGDHETDLPPRSDDDGGVSVLHLVQALAHERADDPPRLVLVTRGAQSVGPDAPAPELAQASIWGLARVVMLEHRELRAKIIDLDPARPDDETDRLFEELGRVDEADQLCLRSAGRYAAALEPWTAPIDADRPATRRPFDRDRDHNLRLLATHPGILDSLTSTVWQRRGPGPGQVEIEIAAAGLNFSDVLKALGICPGVPPGTVPLGAECAGTVTAVGEGVTTYGIGDPVIAVAPSSLAAFTTTEAQLVWPKPNALSDEQAAAVPIAFLTAIHGLEYLARLGAGEKVLIHSATGGVGLAALQVARRHGAEIFATAGTEPKRALLRSLGVKHVMDSRSLRFADEILELTGGRGVDVVLNSLAGEALTRSLGLLAPNGRFVEIGKQDVYSNSHVGLGALKHNRSFFAVDLERSFLEQPDLIARLFRELGRGFENGDFTALPVTGFAYSQADEAFGLMAQARHIGKIVLHPDGRETVMTEAGAPGVRADATYLITGGLGALGLQTARYLVGQGARHLALVGRNGPSAEAEPILAELGSGPAEIRVFSADISQPQDVAHLLAEIDDSMPALAGIVHAAGTLDDGLLQQLDRDRFRSVAAAKVAGAWHLHRASLDRDLDFFVMYSSAAGLLGSPGQGNYAAANAFLDSLAGYRQAHGLPALSIDWGPWSQVGLAAAPERGGALSGVGIASLSVADGIEALNRLLTTSSSQVCVLPLDLDRLRMAADSGLLPGLLGRLIGPAPTNTEPGPSGAGAVRRDLLAVEPGRRRSAILVTHCRAEAGRVLKLDPAQIDPTAPLAGMGFDSLMSLELRRRLERSLHLELPATVAWRFPTIEALVPFLAERMGIALTTPKAGPARPTEPIETGQSTSDDDDLERLTDGEIESLLLAKITHFDEGGRG